MANDLLVIKLNVFLPPKDYEKLYNSFLEERDKGNLILLPAYCDAILVPGDVDVKVKGMEPSAVELLTNDSYIYGNGRN